MGVYDDMAHDAGYRGEEARSVAASIEESERSRYHAEQAAAQEQIPDPVELMQGRLDRLEDGVEEVDGVLTSPCGNCDKRVPIDTLTCMSPMGDDPGLCGDCLEEWAQSKGKSIEPDTA